MVNTGILFIHCTLIDAIWLILTRIMFKEIIWFILCTIMGDICLIMPVVWKMEEFYFIHSSIMGLIRNIMTVVWLEVYITRIWFIDCTLMAAIWLTMTIYPLYNNGWYRISNDCGLKYG